MLSATFDDWGGQGQLSCLFRDPEILYTIRRTCCTSQGDPDSSFPCGSGREARALPRLSGLHYFVPTVLFPCLLLLGSCLLPVWLCLISVFLFSCRHCSACSQPLVHLNSKNEIKKSEKGKGKWKKYGGYKIKKSD